MASTYLSLHYHFIFATKNRHPWIQPDWRSRLHEYIGGTINGMNGQSQIVGGVGDHVHILAGLRATHCVADFMRDLKKSVSIWIHEEILLSDFAWQEGYSAFTVSATSRSSVYNYIANQEEHHRHKTFREELVELLDRAGVKYNDQFLD